MSEKRWYERDGVHPDALAAFRSYERYSDDELVARIDKRLADTSDVSVFPTAKGCSRTALEAMLYFQETLELRELQERNKQRAIYVQLENFYGQILDDDVEGVYLRFRASLQRAPFVIHVRIKEPTNPAEMRKYMIKVQHALTLVGETHKTIKPIEPSPKI